MISYRPFWETLEKTEGISTYVLVNTYGISSATLNRLKTNKPVSTSTLERLCDILHCDLSDVVEYIPPQQQ